MIDRVLATALLVAQAEQNATPWLTPAVGLAGVLAGALIAGGFRLRGDKAARRAEADRKALYDLQAGALDLRMALRDYGRNLPRPDDKQVRAYDEASGNLDVLIHRIENSSLRQHVNVWRDVAQRYWLEDDTVTNHAEQTAWLRIHYYTGQQIRQLDSFSFDQGRR